MNKLTKAAGFTLIELLIAIAVVAILAGIAYPTYMEQVRDSRRTDGRGLLLDTAQAMEKCRTLYGSYNAPLCQVFSDVTSEDSEDFPKSTEGYYLVSAVGAPTETTFTLQAVPQFDDPDCGTFILRQDGDRCIDDGAVKCVSTDDEGAQECW